MFSCRRFLVFTLLLIALFGLVCVYTGWLEMTAFRLLLRTSEESRLGLENYCVRIDAQPIAGIGSNVSGLTYHPGRNTLFSVINRPPQIIELTLDGRLKRRIPIKGVEDVEGISHMRGDEFFISDERVQRLIHVRIDDDQHEIDVRDRPYIGLAFDLAGNFGLEGVSWDHVRGRLFVVKEKRPLRLFELSGLTDLLDERALRLRIGEWPLRDSFAWLLRDLSSLTYHEDSGNMLLLSDESRLIVELGPQRQISGLLVLRRGWHGLKADAPQAEGIAVGAHGEIFVVSEPDLFYRFDPQCR
ncbi:MAG: SdiA-regulated domain-containing protein [Candidatus Accumulibacter sp.]|jgi:uncharacterized protein YjiK|nr:SdiA-regulated domain-containing protein [Accumulibacter sp.]